MEHTFDLAGARRAAEDGRLAEWTLAMVLQEGFENRNLAAILRGQRPLLSGPVRVELATLERLAGPSSEFRYPKEAVRWEREIAPLLALSPESVPPILVRYGNHVSDGNHRVDAWLRQGQTHGWAVVWEDADPRFQNWWAPFPPEAMPTFGAVDPSVTSGFLPAVEAEGTVFAAVSQGGVVGAFRLVPEFGGLTLRTFSVAPEWRGLRLGARMLREARALMEGQVVHCLAYPHLARFYGEGGFERVEPERLPTGLRERYEGMQDERGCVALRRLP